MVRRVFTVLMLFFAVCADACAQGYFCDRADAVLEYVRTTVADGKIKWRHTVRILDVKETADAVTYTSESVFRKPNGKMLYGDAMIEETTVDKRTDDVSLDVGATMVSYIKARTGLNAKADRQLSVLPADMAPGDTLMPVSAQVEVGPLTYTVQVSKRKVLRSETISVPAGTFDCVVVWEKKLEDGIGHHRDVTNLTWYSKGVGMVRHDTYIKGKLDTSEVLEKVK